MAVRSEPLAPARPRLARAGAAPRGPIVLGVAIVALLLGALVLGVAMGTVAVDPGDTLKILGHRLLGLDLSRTWTEQAEVIVMDLRLPRVLTTMLVGMASRSRA